MAFTYNWNLSDLENVSKNGYKVFSCFSCGGGSSMGYKMAGYDVIGTCEIDKKMNEVYQKNFDPKFKYEMGIQEMCKLDTFPDELYNLDILDGSPPCSSFSIAGNREKDWGYEKKFREGQAEQVLDTLFFDFIELGKKLQPKVIIAENVKGLLLGEARDYVQRIYKDLNDAGYVVDHFLLDSSTMGVPQRRERVFFIAVRKDLKNIIYQKDMFHQGPKIQFEFNEKKIVFGEIYDGLGRDISEGKLAAWHYRKDTDTSIADSKERAGLKASDYNCVYLYKHKVMPTITGRGHYAMIHYDKPIHASFMEVLEGGSFPKDYDFNIIDNGYIIGMSVPPIMMYGVAQQVKIQLLDKT